MNEIKHNKLIEAYRYCNDNNKSLEFMIEHMMGFANASLDEVTRWLRIGDYRKGKLS